MCVDTSLPLRDYGLITRSASAQCCSATSLFLGCRHSGEEVGMVASAGWQDMLAQPPCSLTPRVTPCLSDEPPAPGLQGNWIAMWGKHPLWPVIRPSSRQWRSARGTPLRPARIQPITSGSNCCRYCTAHTAVLPSLPPLALPCPALPCPALPCPALPCLVLHVARTAASRSQCINRVEATKNKRERRLTQFQLQCCPWVK